MSKVKVKLTIQEIVCDFESLVRHDERLDVHFDLKKADDGMISKFHEDLKEMAEKYIPGYEEKIPQEYFSKDSEYEKALVLYGVLYENFKEILYQLV